MPREPGVWWWKARRQWYSTVRGRQVPLGVYRVDDREGAIAALRRALASLTPGTKEGESPPAQTVKVAAAEYLASAADKLSPGTLRYYRIGVTKHFCAAFGPRGVASLSAGEIEAWAQSCAKEHRWSQSTRRNYLGVVAAFLAWCGHPVKLRRPAMESRGADAVLTDEQFAQVLEAYRSGRKKPESDFLTLLALLRETGARPGEVVGLTVEGVDWANGCARIKQHKTARKGHKRILYFNSAALEVLEGQRAKHGSGLLFRNCRGTGYTVKALTLKCWTLAQKLPFKVLLYGLGRHSFATRALVNGVPDTHVAALLGHRGTDMLHAHYSHINSESRMLREAAEKAGKRAG